MRQVVRPLIVATVAGDHDAAIAQVRFRQNTLVVRCEIRKLAMTEMGQKLPVVARRSRQHDTQKLSVGERNATPTEVPRKAADRRLAGEGQETLGICCVASLIDRDC